MDEIETDTDSNLSPLFQDSDNSCVETEQELEQVLVQADERGALRLAT